MLNIIMYHYIRNNENHSYDCYARRKEEFESQVIYFKKHWEIIDPSDIEKTIYFLKNESQNGFMLTFDDGYKDHLYCSKFLKSENIKGIFFPPIKSLEGELLDVNLIHILLGSRDTKKKFILEKIIILCNELSIRLNLGNRTVTIKQYIEGFKEKCKRDDITTLLIKKILQRDIIDEKKRKEICINLFESLIKAETKEEAENLYLTIEELKIMKNNGMYFGSHGLKHLWLNTLDKKRQLIEIKNSFDYLKEIDIISSKDPLIMCYPYGGYNKITLEIMRDLNIDYALTTKVGSASSFFDTTLFELRRWDTNDCWDNDFRKPKYPSKL